MKWFTTSNEPAHKIMALSVLHKLILQTRMHIHPMGLDVWFLVGPFVYFCSLCVQTAKALVKLRRCAGSPEPSLVAYVISTIISWAGSNHYILPPHHRWQNYHRMSRVHPLIERDVDVMIPLLGSVCVYSLVVCPGLCLRLDCLDCNRVWRYCILVQCMDGL